MATFNVSGASQLASAINSARGGDVIRCAAGNYGKLNLTKKFSGNVTITSASDSNKASFAGIDVRNAANVTFDSLKIDGPGRSGTGVKVSLSNNVKVTDSDVSDFLYGMQFSRVTGLTVSNNDLSRMWNDCMRFGQVINATISGNDFEQRALAVELHPQGPDPVLDQRRRGAVEERADHRQSDGQPRRRDPRHLHGQRRGARRQPQQVSTRTSTSRTTTCAPRRCTASASSMSTGWSSATTT